MLVECGFVRATAGDGAEWTFTPSLARIAALGNPYEIVALYADLHGAKAEAAAAYVLAGLCDQEDPSPLIGWHEEANVGGVTMPVWRPGMMPAGEQVIFARHLMRHGIVGKAKPSDAGSGKFSDRFDAAEYVAAARVHLGMSREDAEALSMTEFQLMLEMKFPDAKNGQRDVPTKEEYDAQMAAYMEKRRG